MRRHHLIVSPEHSDLRSAGVSLIYTRTISKKIKNLANFFSPSQMLAKASRSTRNTTTKKKQKQNNKKNTLDKPRQESLPPRSLVHHYINFSVSILINVTKSKEDSQSRLTLLCSLLYFIAKTLQNLHEMKSLRPHLSLIKKSRVSSSLALLCRPPSCPCRLQPT